jgi:hypothetical protein
MYKKVFLYLRVHQGVLLPELRKQQSSKGIIFQSLTNNFENLQHNSDLIHMSINNDNSKCLFWYMYEIK